MGGRGWRRWGRVIWFLSVHAPAHLLWHFVQRRRFATSVWLDVARAFRGLPTFVSEASSVPVGGIEASTSFLTFGNVHSHRIGTHLF